MNLELITKQVANISRATGTFLKNELHNIKSTDIQEKGINDFVTYVDKTSEKRIVTELSRILPEAGFIAEENQSYERKDKYNWIIDPLDGTTNFIHGVPLYSISIALMENNEIISGVVYEVNQKECFYAWQGSSAFLNGHKINVSKVKTVKDSLFATGFPYYDYSRLNDYMNIFTHLMKNSHGVRRLGSAAVDLAYVACGRYDGFYEYGLHPWDVAAGEIIVRQAGGAVSDFKGNNNHIFGKEIVAANKNIFGEFLELTKKHFK